jgi:hypothetical protein
MTDAAPGTNRHPLAALAGRGRRATCSSDPGHAAVGSPWPLRQDSPARDRRLSPLRPSLGETAHRSLPEAQFSMLPPSPPLLDRILPSLDLGIPTAGGFGLTVIPVGHRALPNRSPPGMIFGERDPPQPTEIIAGNPTRRTIVVPLGQVVSGGMADRAVATTVAIPPGGTAVLPVEPLSAQWWDAGVMGTAGELSSVLSALLIMARRGRPGLRSTARTALWAAYRHGGDVPPPHGGWVLVRGSRVVALHLTVSSRLPSREADSPATRSLPLGRSLSAGADAELVRHVVRHGRWTELWLVRASPELPDLCVGRELNTAQCCARRVEPKMVATPPANVRRGTR